MPTASSVGRVTTVDLLASGDEPQPRPSRGRPTLRASSVLIALAVAIALILTTGVTAVVRLSGGGPQPEDALPASAFAFAKLDLDPPASQKLAVRTLARHFPDSPGDDLRELRDAAASELVEPLGLDFDTDVEPWLGDRYAVAGFVVDDEMHPVAAVQVSDESAAREAIEKADVEGGVAFLRGYAVIAETQDIVDAAVRQARETPLGSDRGFARDIAELSGDQIAIGWADNEQLYDRVFSGVVTELEMDATAHDPRAGISGRSVVGLHATRRYVELESISVGADAGPAGTPADVSMLTALPTSTTAAVLLTNPAALRASSAAYSAFGAIGGAGLLGVGLGAFPVDDGSMSAVSDALEPLDQELETDLLPLLRGTTALVLGPLPGGASSRGDVSLMLVADVAAPGNAEVPLLRVRDALRKAGLTADVAIRGGRVYAATGSAYVEGLGDAGHLGDSELFRDAMGSMSGDVSIAAYVDIASIARTQPDFPRGLAPVQAVGLTSSRDGSTSTVRLRVVIGAAG